MDCKTYCSENKNIPEKILSLMWYSTDSNLLGWNVISLSWFLAVLRSFTSRIAKFEGKFFRALKQFFQNTFSDVQMAFVWHLSYPSQKTKITLLTLL